MAACRQDPERREESFSRVLMRMYEPAAAWTLRHMDGVRRSSLFWPNYRSQVQVARPEFMLDEQGAVLYMPICCSNLHCAGEARVAATD
jgi:hypothetical protein